MCYFVVYPFRQKKYKEMSVLRLELEMLYVKMSIIKGKDFIAKSHFSSRTVKAHFIMNKLFVLACLAVAIPSALGNWSDAEFTVNTKEVHLV